MGVVLQRLAQRTLPGTGGVRPRLAERYEAAVKPIEGIGESFGKQVVVAPPSIASPPLSPVTTPRRAPQAAPAPDPRRVAQAPVEAPGVAAMPPDPADERRNGAAPPHLFEAAPIQPASALYALPVATDPARAMAPDSAFPLSEPFADSLTPDQPAAFPARDAPIEPFGLLLPELRTTIDAAVATSPLPAPRGPGATAREAPPDVHISIGRIEVRADRPEPRKPPHPRARLRMMSLEDYLAKGRGR